METCVLIPQDFSLVLTAPGAKKSREQVASVWSTSRIQQGTLCYPFQGTVRIDKLNIHSYVEEDDVSFSLFLSILCYVRILKAMHECHFHLLFI